jgi:hypothetical protein
VTVGRDKVVTVHFPRRAHNPLLRAVRWDRLPDTLPGIDGVRLVLGFA